MSTGPNRHRPRHQPRPAGAPTPGDGAPADAPKAEGPPPNGDANGRANRGDRVRSGRPAPSGTPNGKPGRGPKGPHTPGVPRTRPDLAPPATAPSANAAAALERLRLRVGDALRELDRLRAENDRLAARVAELETEADRAADAVTIAGEDPEALRAKVEGFIEALDQYLAHDPS